MVDKPARRANLYGVVKLPLVLEDLEIRRGSGMRSMRENELIELDHAWYRTRFFSRVLALVAPPVGFLLLWTTPGYRLWQKILGSVGLGLYTVLYAGLIIGIGMESGWWEVEWRGGDYPVIVSRRSGPNPDLLEAHRKAQAQLPPPRLDPAAHPPPYWTDFRGPHRDGHYDETSILTRWPAPGLRELWRNPCGGGYASFVVAEGLAFTIEQRRELEVIAAYALDTGREVWTYDYPARFEEWMGGDGPRATPTYYGGRLYSLGARGDLICLGAATGTVVWQHNVLADAGSENLTYGLAASPLIVEEQLLVTAGRASAKGTLLAYDALTGELLWSALPEQQGYASPVPVEIGGREQVLLLTASRLLGFDPRRREVLWDFPWQVRYENSICLPVPVDGSRFFLGAGYGSGSALVEVRGADDPFQATAVWQNRNLRTKFNPAVFWDGYLYGLDEGVLACVEAATGEQKWREGRYGYGQLLVTQGHLLVLSGDGQVALVKADPNQYSEVNRFRALRGKCWNVPALASGRLLVRNSEEMACYQISSLAP